MPILEISQQPGRAPDRYDVEVELSDVLGVGKIRFSREIAFALPAADRERIRWYLEDYLEFDHDPAPAIAKSVETLMERTGADLFAQVFQSSPEGQRCWALASMALPQTRIEIVTDVRTATDLPWELMRDAASGTTLALSAREFVRGARGAQQMFVAQEEPGVVRILLVIARPGGGRDVPFRSVASRLVRRLGDAAGKGWRLDVLRPPTFRQLASVLRTAADSGEPYHVVHFDGHGGYGDLASPSDGMGRSSVHAYDAAAGGRQGFLVFEDDEKEDRSDCVGGDRLGPLLRDAGVQALILNACRSAFAESPNEPAPESDEARTALAEAAAYGSLAQQVMQAGLGGVVAMRYSVWVVTAADFVERLYERLSSGATLGQAVAAARKALADDPMREVGAVPRPLSDWHVPLVWERAPQRLWPQRAAAVLAAPQEASRGAFVDPKLPRAPDFGFFGRDETLHALDRGFDDRGDFSQRVILLSAFAGSGKTQVAAEFARWYAATGGVQGAVLFSSFERHLPLPRVLDRIGEMFGGALAAAGVQWHAIVDEAERRAVALDVLRQVPVLWIWDNVEPVAGFPSGAVSAWSPEEQRELADFLRDAAGTKAKFLLTSRRNERAWLGDLPLRLALPPMPMRERRQMAAAIAARHRKRLADLPDLTTLLRFTRGNPLTVRAAVGGMLEQAVATAAQLADYVAALEAGRARFGDEAGEGRDASLAASLSYGFAHGFSEAERAALALLHLFHGFVDVDAVRIMGDPNAPWTMEAVRNATRETLIPLFDRAAEIGLLTALGDGYYSIHPALPWFFRDLFERHHASEAGERARTAFVAAMGMLGNFYHNQINRGNADARAGLAAEEDNLLAAWSLATEAGDWARAIRCMQGLKEIYAYGGRRGAWRALVAPLRQALLDPHTEDPPPGLEDEWLLALEYDAGIAMEDRDWSHAAAILRNRIDWRRTTTAGARARADAERTGAERNALRSLAASLHQLGEMLTESGSPDCVPALEEAKDIAAVIGDRRVEAGCAFYLGNAHVRVPSIRDLGTAEHWYRTSLALRAADDRAGRGRCYAQLGSVALRRSYDARVAGADAETLLGHLNAAYEAYREALDAFGADDLASLAVTHNQLGVVFRIGGAVDQALAHYRQSIAFEEQAQNPFGSAETRFNVGLMLFEEGRLLEARAYAHAAREQFASLRDAETYVEDCDRLLAKIEAAIAAQGDPPP
ncbi:CHAT domain-containing protein [Aquibium microcysteis]|uniref:CHAT domain-containing protein n=1 Tax=Aquibium microcysteis TaxID=675281 RepID=UPI00165D2EB9|nr:CHAT domain-containing protein [Aquibium microcysteis]